MSLRLNRMFFFLFSTVLLCTSLHSRPTQLTQMKGLFDCVIEEKQHLSPFHGFVWIETDLLERYYHFGNADVEKKHPEFPEVVTKVNYDSPLTDKTIALVLSLFHRERQSQIFCTKTPSNPASLFTVRTIGQILNAIENNLASEKPDPKKLFNQLLPIIMATKAIEQNVSFNELWNTITNSKTLQNASALCFTKKEKGMLDFSDEKQFRKKLQQLAELKDDAWQALFTPKSVDKKSPAPVLTDEQQTTIASTIAALKDAVARYQKLTADQETRTADQNSWKGACGFTASLIIQSLTECGHFESKEEQKYPNYITHMILLSLAYLKADGKNDFNDYFSAFTPSILRDDAQEILNQSFNPEITNSKTLTEQSSYEDIALTIINETADGLPEFSTYGNYYPFKTASISVSENVKPDTYADCGEFLVFNFLKTLIGIFGLYNDKNQSITLENMEEIIKDFLNTKKIRFDKEKFNINCKKLTNLFTSIPNLTQPEFHQVLGDLLSNVPGVKYLRKIQLNTPNTIVEKNNNIPSIHPTEQNTITQTETGTLIDGHPAQVPGEDYYLFEIAGYPGNLTAIFNYFFGSHLKNLQELCDALNITISNFQTDEQVYNNGSQKMILSGTANNKTFSIVMNPTKGHSSFIKMGTGEGGDANERNLSYSIKDIFTANRKKFHQSLTSQNIMACFIRYTQITANEKIGNESPNQIIENDYLAMHLCLTDNLYNQGTISSLFSRILPKKVSSEKQTALLTFIDRHLSKIHSAYIPYVIREMLSNITSFLSPPIDGVIKKLLDKITDSYDIGSILAEIVENLCYFKSMSIYNFWDQHQEAITNFTRINGIKLLSRQKNKIPASGSGQTFNFFKKIYLEVKDNFEISGETSTFIFRLLFNHNLTQSLQKNPELINHMCNMITSTQSKITNPNAIKRSLQSLREVIDETYFRPKGFKSSTDDQREELEYPLLNDLITQINNTPVREW